MFGNLLSFLWGFAEATLFFIVPDVGLSVIVLNGYEAGLEACLYALAGAIVGGCLMYYAGRSNLDNVLRIFLKIPAIREIDLERVRKEMDKYGAIATLWGPLIGIPYKIYAAYAHLFTSIFVFMLISIPARLVRFVLVTLFVPNLMNWIAPNAAQSTQTLIVLSIWTVVYAGYFYVKRK